MEKNKKIIIGVISTIIIIALIIGVVYIVRQDINNSEKTSRLTNVYENLTSKGQYTFTEELDENNKITYSIDGERAFVDSIYDGQESKYIVKDGNTYLLIDNEKTYYKYENNVTDVSVIPTRIEKAIEMDFSTGTEKVENKNYNYEEFEGYSDFSFREDESSDSSVRTRFYFDGTKLAYIKTITNDGEELLKVNLTYNVQNQNFDIPSNYVES